MEYAAEGFEERSLPKLFIFLVVFACFAGKYHEKGMILGGSTTPGTLWVNLPFCKGGVARVQSSLCPPLAIDKTYGKP
jgi:hypothetical protein